jgi:cytochrome c-type biogenesis protein CcmH/NrfG
MRKQAETGSNAYRSKPFGIMALEVAAVIHAARNGPNDREGAERLLKEATALELTLDAPSGPPEPLKPAFELYGDLLLEQGRAKEAAAQFEQALVRMPNRRASLHGLERAKAAVTTQSR